MIKFSTPILLIVFNRPEETNAVFQEIRKLQPKFLYVAADGPRRHVKGEDDLCAATRKIFESVDWPCELKVNFQTENLGCRTGVSTAINWFFEEVEEGIILEDDCVPSATFFSFCQKMLEKYRTDERIMQVSGTNLVGRWKHEQCDYFFSYYGTIWGWATWRRAWKLYDVDMKLWAMEESEQAVKNVLMDEKQYRLRKQICNSVFNHELDTWDYQWTFCKLINSGLSITPSVNLVSNIGFSNSATHTKNMTALANMPRHEISGELKDQPFIVPDRQYDQLFMKQAEAPFIKRAINKILRIVK